MVPHCDVVTINAPLYPGTEGLFNDELIATMKRGSYIVNAARRSVTAMPSSGHWKAGSWRDTPVMSGSPSPHRGTIHRAACRTMA